MRKLISHDYPVLLLANLDYSFLPKASGRHRRTRRRLHHAPDRRRIYSVTETSPHPCKTHTHTLDCCQGLLSCEFSPIAVASDFNGPTKTLKQPGHSSTTHDTGATGSSLGISPTVFRRFPGASQLINSIVFHI